MMCLFSPAQKGEQIVALGGSWYAWSCITVNSHLGVGGARAAVSRCSLGSPRVARVSRVSSVTCVVARGRGARRVRAVRSAPARADVRPVRYRRRAPPRTLAAPLTHRLAATSLRKDTNTQSLNDRLF